MVTTINNMEKREKVERRKQQSKAQLSAANSSIHAFYAVIVLYVDN
jgi:hypothetical protein